MSFELPSSFKPSTFNPSSLFQSCFKEKLFDALLQDIGAQYTSVDVLMQSAIQTWANTNTWTDKLLCMIGWKQPGYDPRLDYGDGGGLSYSEVTDFIKDNIGGESAMSYKRRGMMTYDYVGEIIDDITKKIYEYVRFNNTLTLSESITGGGGELYQCRQDTSLTSFCYLLCFDKKKTLPESGIVKFKDREIKIEIDNNTKKFHLIGPIWQPHY